MRQIKQALGSVPGLRSAYRFVLYPYARARSRQEVARLRNSTAEEVFTDIFRGNRWGGIESVSGEGSNLLQTRVVREALPSVLRQFSLHSMLDIPCGDFHWMKHVDLQGVDYTGADIVPDLIARNAQQHEAPQVHFRKLNLLEDKLPEVDLVFCRDCLVHLSFADTFTGLRNICDSGSRYLLTTTFPSRQTNADIVTGMWRTINLEAPPFSLPPPLMLINEECTESDGEFRDKSLGLWKVADIRDCLTRHPN